MTDLKTEPMTNSNTDPMTDSTTDLMTNPLTLVSWQPLYRPHVWHQDMFVETDSKTDLMNDPKTGPTSDLMTVSMTDQSCDVSFAQLWCFFVAISSWKVKTAWGTILDSPWICIQWRTQHFNLLSQVDRIIFIYEFEARNLNMFCFSFVHFLTILQIKHVRNLERLLFFDTWTTYHGLFEKRETWYFCETFLEQKPWFVLW